MNNEEILEIVQNVDHQMDNQHSFDQETRKERKLRIIVEMFLRTNGMYTDMQLEKILREANQLYSNIPVISRSSIDRYLKDQQVGHLFGLEKYRHILEKRRQNLLEAKSKGGQHFAENNMSLKNEKGEFIGSMHR